MSLHVFGVRHHGPGSARSLLQALEALQPDVILVEGPPDAADVLPLLVHPEMQPPVALLLYVPEQPQRAVYYPFAVFSPEWQALHYGLTHNITVRFIDLPQQHQLALPVVDPTSEGSTPEGLTPEPTSPEPQPAPQADPWHWLAEAAGYGDGERFWEHLVEERRNSADVFAAVLEAMTALRNAAPASEDPGESQREARREAFMRQTIRTAQHEGFQRIAVVCGAWHAPALVEMPPAKEDATLLKGLPKAKVQATWVPWTYGRLSYASGYGAGIESPGWYHHLWTTSDAVVTRWITRVARLLREEDLDASAAHIIEAVRLAESLAALRDRPLPGLPELNEAAQAVFCFGNDLPMRLIHQKLIVGETLGKVPDETPMVPLQQDLSREQKRLRLPVEAVQRILDLDLRKTTDLERSHLLHRLGLLGVSWGTSEQVTGKTGTFHELWRLQWQPEFAVALIEAGIWGNTIYDAATAYTRDAANRAPDLPALTNLLDRALLADLPEAAGHLMARLQAEAALANDVTHLMAALPPLANILRYGNVRQTDASMVNHVVDGLVARICIGLPGACASLNDEAATAMFDLLMGANNAVLLLQDAGRPEHLIAWHETLRKMAGQQGLHGLLAGRCCRILLDSGTFDASEVERRMGLALSAAGEPAGAAAWVEGFLKGSGLLLLHDDTLWQMLDSWVTALPGDTFTALLPLLRRTFSTFAAPERRQMGERVRRGPASPADLALTAIPAAATDPAYAAIAGFDLVRAEAVLPLVAQLMGITKYAGYPGIKNADMQSANQNSVQESEGNHDPIPNP